MNNNLKLIFYLFIILSVFIFFCSNNRELFSNDSNDFKQLKNGYVFNKVKIKYYPKGGPYNKIDDIKDRREEGETILRKNQYVGIRMLLIFNFICKKYKIKYWLTDGTLIGAVRHKGFIPWDNDVDILMIKSDFKKLEKIILSNKDNIKSILHDNNIFFQISDGVWRQNRTLIAKFRDNNSCYGYCKKHGCKWHDGIQLDIFICDYTKKKDKIYILDENWNKILVKKNKIFPLKNIKFENHLLPVPNDYNYILKKEYGDFMKLPSERKRYPHEGIGTYNKPC
jgi:lipopolysaccharide cholinephosphotransferase